jgi:hypothetical protein
MKYIHENGPQTEAPAQKPREHNPQKRRAYVSFQSNAPEKVALAYPDALNVLFPLPIYEKAIRSAYALRRWLAREILGCEIPRKPPSGLLNAWDQPVMRANKAWLCSLPCCLCGLVPAGEAAHTGRDGGMGAKSLRLFVRPFMLRLPHTKMRTPTID